MQKGVQNERMGTVQKAGGVSRHYLATAWMTIAATRDEQGCATQKREWEAKPFPKDQFYEGMRLRYLCLPDTVDPRGAKGK